MLGVCGPPLTADTCELRGGYVAFGNTEEPAHEVVLGWAERGQAADGPFDRRTVPGAAPCWRGEVRSARRKGWTAAHAPLRRAVRSAAAHAARHALSTSRSAHRSLTH